MDTASGVNTLVSDELEKRWKCIQQKTTREIDWEVPTGQQLMVAARMKLPKSLRHLKKAKKLNDTMQSRAGSKEWVSPRRRGLLRHDPAAPPVAQLA